eukprot:GDKH01005867.1.p1 GENE.GDKH01005867.1~~GDKH01005867.1.p1  ORF type:complete len:62 (+),score=1.84 GDKH01005867.1:183-368(+)
MITSKSLIISFKLGTILKDLKFMILMFFSLTRLEFSKTKGPLWNKLKLPISLDNFLKKSIL